MVAVNNEFQGVMVDVGILGVGDQVTVSFDLVLNITGSTPNLQYGLLMGSWSSNTVGVGAGTAVLAKWNYGGTGHDIQIRFLCYSATSGGTQHWVALCFRPKCVV